MWNDGRPRAAVFLGGRLVIRAFRPSGLVVA